MKKIEKAKRFLAVSGACGFAILSAFGLHGITHNNRDNVEVKAYGYDDEYIQPTGQLTEEPGNYFQSICWNKSQTPQNLEITFVPTPVSYYNGFARLVTGRMALQEYHPTENTTAIGLTWGGEGYTSNLLPDDLTDPVEFTFGSAGIDGLYFDYFTGEGYWSFAGSTYEYSDYLWVVFPQPFVVDRIGNEQGKIIPSYSSNDPYANQTYGTYADGYSQGFDDGFYEGERTANERGRQNWYDEGYRDGYSQGDTDGYNRGYERGWNAAGTGPTSVVGGLFMSIANVPITILNGLGAFSVWNVSLMTILATFLFLALIIWVIRKLI